MASTLKIAHTDLITRLETIAEARFVQLWNDHVARLTSGEGYSFDTPAIFVEWTTEAGNTIGGVGMTDSDVIIKIHIVHQELDATGGRLEQNLNVFDIRDAVKVKLSRFFPRNCSGLQFIGEEEDPEHTNLYHYIMMFKTAYIDSKGSPLDPDSDEWIEYSAPTMPFDLNLIVEYSKTPE